MLFKDYNALLVRLFLGYLFTSSGLCKLTDGHFGQLIGPPLLIDQLAQYGLRTFAFFIAISQVMAGALVLSQRYSVLGLIMLVPMNLGILMVTISQNWTGTPYVDAVFTLLNLLALLYEWPSLKFLVLPDTLSIQPPPKTNRFFGNQWIPASVIVAFAVCCVMSRWNHPITTAIAAIGYVAVYINVFSSQSFVGFYRWTLGTSLLAVLTVTFVGYLLQIKWPFNPMLLMAIPVLATFVLYLLTLIWFLVYKKNITA